MYFQSRRLGDIAPTFLSPLLPKRLGNLLLLRGAPLLERPHETQQEQTPAAEGVPRESHQEQALDADGVPEFQPMWVSTPEGHPNAPAEQKSTQEEPPSFIPEEEQESSDVPEKSSHPGLKVRIPFFQKV